MPNPTLTLRGDQKFTRKLLHFTNNQLNPSIENATIAWGVYLVIDIFINGVNRVKDTGTIRDSVVTGSLGI